MLYSYLYGLHEIFSPFNVFRYITFRTALAVITSALITFCLAPYIIQWLKGFSLTQQIREEGPKNHQSKAGTPTMGGILIIISTLTAVLLWANLSNRYIWLMIVSTLCFSGIGFVDDYLKITRHNSKGLRAKYKFGLQILSALFVAVILYLNPQEPNATKLMLPFFKQWFLDMGVFYIPFAVFVITGASNAVNLTDGIDGLAIGLVAIAVLANAIFIYISGHARLAEYLQVLYITGAGELTVFCGALFGSAIGFLWYNTYPAEMFMGDVGSLGLGGALGTLAVITKHEIVLAVVGGIFVLETLSVILQVASFKMTGKRIFRMAPVHHHFELKGWPEPKAVVRFWIIGLVLALLSLSTLKLR